MEVEMKAEISSLKQDNAILNIDRDHWHASYRLAQDRQDALQNDRHSQESVKERMLTARLTEEIAQHNMRHAAHKDEMVALNKARDLENVEFATTMRMNLQSTMEQLRNVLAQKTVNESLFESLLMKMEMHAEQARGHYLAIIEGKDGEISTLRDGLQSERIIVEDMKRSMTDKEIELVRALAEISDFRLKDSERRRQVTDSAGEAASTFQAQVNKGEVITGRAPRLRLQQMEEATESAGGSTKVAKDCSRVSVRAAPPLQQEERERIPIRFVRIRKCHKCNRASGGSLIDTPVAGGQNGAVCKRSQQMSCPTRPGSRVFHGVTMTA